MKVIISLLAIFTQISSRLLVFSAYDQTAQTNSQTLASNLQTFKKNTEFFGLRTHMEGIISFNCLTKLKAYRQFIERTADADIILFTDPFNTLIDADDQEILAWYKIIQERENKPVIISAEATLSPNSPFAGQFPSGPTSSRYLNPGGIIGDAASLKQVIFNEKDSQDIKYQPQGDFDDREYLSKVFFSERGKKLIYLDVRSEIFKSLDNQAQFSYLIPEENVWIDAESGHKPLVYVGGTPSRDFLFGQIQLTLQFSQSPSKTTLVIPLYQYGRLLEEFSFFGNDLLILKHPNMSADHNFIYANRKSHYLTGRTIVKDTYFTSSDQYKHLYQACMSYSIQKGNSLFCDQSAQIYSKLYVLMSENYRTKYFLWVEYEIVESGQMRNGDRIGFLDKIFEKDSRIRIGRVDNALKTKIFGGSVSELRTLRKLLVDTIRGHIAKKTFPGTEEVLLEIANTRPELFNIYTLKSGSFREFTLYI